MGDTGSRSWTSHDLDSFLWRRHRRWVDALMAHGATEECAVSALVLCERGARERGENPDTVCGRFVADFLEARP